MKFLADENIPLLMVQQLEEKGYDIKCISTENPGIPDEEVLNLANQEDRILVTFPSLYASKLNLRKK